MAEKLRLVLCWHFHQPDYRHPETGQYRLPWTYLHAVKDYADMAGHLEAHPEMKAVVNFVPILVEQIQDYARQLANGELRDPLLAMLARPDLDHLDDGQRDYLLETCFRANEEKLVDPFPAYRRLLDIRQRFCDEDGEVMRAYLSGQYFADLVTWYHIAWTGETLRRHDPRLAALMAKGEGFNLNDRQTLLAVYRDTLGQLLPRYRELARRGQVELSATPYNHPLAPLMVDFASAREAMPDCSLPVVPSFPGGRSRVTSHIRRAIDAHTECFGQPPDGMWPAEGSISTPVVRLFSEQNVRWLASGQKVLENSLDSSDARLDQRLYQPWRLGSAPKVALFFRDDRLSDQIGFEYARWFAADAINHFVTQLEDIRRAAAPGSAPVVSVILDGENAWEYYPYNGWYFLDGLYKALTQRPDIETSTFAENLDAPCATLDRLVAGSWVYGTFSTWIGETAKNRAWEFLAVAKGNLDMRLPELSEEARVRVLEQLANCEASDWFWWMGDYNPSDSVEAFDHLFRHNLKLLYTALDLPPPINLDHPISHGNQRDGGHSGTMRRSS